MCSRIKGSNLAINSTIFRKIPLWAESNVFDDPRNARFWVAISRITEINLRNICLQYSTRSSWIFWFVWSIDTRKRSRSSNSFHFPKASTWELEHSCPESASGRCLQFWYPHSANGMVFVKNNLQQKQKNCVTRRWVHQTLSFNRFSVFKTPNKMCAIKPSVLIVLWSFEFFYLKWAMFY